MTDDMSLSLVEQRVAELSEKALEQDLSQIEQDELSALKAHHRKAPAVAHRIRILAAKLAQPTKWGPMWRRFSKKFKANFAELEALKQYGHSKAVWEIAYLQRKKAGQKLTRIEHSELQYLVLYHDSPEVLRLTQLKVKETFDHLNSEECRELIDLHRNLYRKEGIPHQLLELFWPSSLNHCDDLTG